MDGTFCSRLFRSETENKSAIVNPKWLALVAVLLALSVPAQAQQSTKIPRIGYLTGQSQASSAAGSNIDAFRQGLREFGYIEGKNIVIEYRGAGGKLDRMPELAAELVALRVDIIVTTGMPAVLAAKRATATIPIVTANADNLVEAGVVASLARPGGNVTGSNRVDADFSAKRLEFLKETFPKLSRVAVLSHGALGGDEEELTETQAAARTLGIQIQSLQVQDPNQFIGAYAEMTKRGADALIIFTSSFTSFHRRELLKLATKNGLPTMCAQAAWTEAGCFIAYGPSPTELYRRAAYFIDRILRGTKPADLPVERARKYELIINLKTAKQIGVTIPANVLARADKVIQ
jgi:putative tryptophan/tyrosine transport system substrate-binding protein